MRTPSAVGPKVGTVLRGAADEYEISAVLGTEGMMGDSFVAKRKSIDESVFIKTPHIPVSEAWDYFFVKDLLARVFASLFSEYANFSRLHGLDCVARIVDAGLFAVTASSTYPMLLPFLVQDYIQGTNLKEHYQNGGGVESAEKWFEESRKIVQVIDQVHSRQVVHGDIHPGNIMRATVNGQEPRIILVDFGQAFLADCSLAAPEPTKRNAHNVLVQPEMEEAPVRVSD